MLYQIFHYGSSFHCLLMCRISCPYPNTGIEEQTSGLAGIRALILVRAKCFFFYVCDPLPPPPPPPKMYRSRSPMPLIIQALLLHVQLYMYCKWIILDLIQNHLFGAVSFPELNALNVCILYMYVCKFTHCKYFIHCL